MDEQSFNPPVCAPSLCLAAALRGGREGDMVSPVQNALEVGRGVSAEVRLGLKGLGVRGWILYHSDDLFLFLR